MWERTGSVLLRAWSPPLRSPAPDIVGLLWLQTLPMPLTAWCPIWLSFNCDTQVTKITHSLWSGGYLRKWSDILICCHSSCDCNSLISRDWILATVFISHICTALCMVTMLQSVISSSLIYMKISANIGFLAIHIQLSPAPSAGCPLLCGSQLSAYSGSGSGLLVREICTRPRELGGGDSRAETTQTASMSSSYSSV